MKKSIGIILLIICLVLFPGCNRKENDVVDPAGKRYVYEKDGAGGAFIINIQSDGMFSYYEGNLSSHAGTGTWTLKGDTLILQEEKTKWNAEKKEIEEYTTPFLFKLEEGALVFIEKGSGSFIHVEVKDGERFLEAPSQNNSETTP